MTDTFLPAPLRSPSSGELLAGMGSEPPVEPTISAKQRLLLAPKLNGNLSSGTPTASFVPEQINAQARMAQYLESDPDDSVWRKLAPQPQVLRDAPGKSFQKLLGGSALPEEEWENLKVSLHEVRDAIQDVDDSLTVGSGKVTSVYPSDGVWMTVEFPDGDLPGSLSGDSTGIIPESALAWPAAKAGITVFAGPSDVVYAAPLNEKTDKQLRNFAPGPVGKDGIPRWQPVVPLQVPSHRQVEGQTVTKPGLVVDSYVRQEHYPGTKGGDWLVWDVPAPTTPKGWRPPEWMRGRAERIRAGVATSVPEYALNRLIRDDIVDQNTLNQRLEDTSWAVFEAQHDPQRTSHLISRLKRDGFEPIEVKAEDDRRAWLVFGVDPSKASELSPRRPVFTNDGVVFDGEEPQPRRYTMATPGGAASFVTQEGQVAGAVPRTSRRVDRWQFKVDPDQAHRLSKLATDLEALGAQNVSIYAHETEVEGFEPAREHLFSDGVSLRVVRSKSSEIGESNSIPLFVRSTVGLPE